MCTVLGVPRMAHITVPLLPTPIQVLYGMGPGYLRSWLTSKGLMHCTCDSIKGLLQTPRISVGGIKAFSVVAPTLWNTWPTEVRSAPILLAFWKGIKTWHCCLLEAPKGLLTAGGGWQPHLHNVHPLVPVFYNFNLFNLQSFKIWTVFLFFFLWSVSHLELLYWGNNEI